MADQILMDTEPGSPKALLKGTVSGAAKVTLVDDAGDPVSVGSGGALTRATLPAAVTSTGAGSAVADSGNAPSFDVSVTGTGSVSATVVIRGRNTASGSWITLGTVTLSGTTSAADGFSSAARYMEYSANVTAISGTGAAVTATMGS